MVHITNKQSAQIKTSKIFYMISCNVQIMKNQNRNSKVYSIFLSMVLLIENHGQINLMMYPC